MWILLSVWCKMQANMAEFRSDAIYPDGMTGFDCGWLRGVYENGARQLLAKSAETGQEETGVFGCDNNVNRGQQNCNVEIKITVRDGKVVSRELPNATARCFVYRSDPH